MDRSLIDPVAYYTLWLTIFTGGLAVAGVAQWSLISGQLKLARDEFNATHRPRIICRDVDMVEGGINYILVNAGDAPGTIVESWILPQLCLDEPSNLRSLAHDDLGKLHFGVGQIRDLTRATNGDQWFKLNFPNAQVGEHQRFFFLGTIVYIDAAGNKRRSVFRREWDGARFVRSQNPDHEYAD